jgi:CDP-diacylglycerol---serine O-phosphatidyltransferase
MKFRQYVPNTLTMLNLASGMISITMVFRGALLLASLYIFIAAVFDFLDGMAARLLDARSELGKQLDSLADIVAFGVAPAMIVFRMLSFNCEGSCNILDRLYITPYFSLLIPICSAIRLGKFNLDLRQEENFTGLPTPANALFFASIPPVLLLQGGFFPLLRLGLLTEFFSSTRVLAVLTVLFSYMLVSDFRMFSMKFKSTKWAGNEYRYLFLILSAALLLLFSFGGIPLAILLYFLLSLVFQKKLV